VILLGLVVSIPSVLIGWWFARRVPPGEEEVSPVAEGERLGNLPSFRAALLPLLLPVLLIALGSLVPVLDPSPGVRQTLFFLCNPNCALLLGVALAFTLLGRRRKDEWNGWIQNALSGAGPIILITAAGGALGAVLKATPLADTFRALLAGKQLSFLYLFPVAYLLAAGLKTAQGSSTASLIITSSIIAPLLGGLPIDHPAGKALLVLSIGAGAMTVSHANDSYFWVISQYSRLPAGKMYRHFTVATFFMGLGVLLSCLLLGLLF
jgi:GntP family gluconate:H+ symporter